MKLSIINSTIFTAVFIFCVSLGAQKRITDHPWQYYLKKGQLQYKYEMYDYALFNLNKALLLNRDCGIAAELMGDIYVKKHNKAQALEYYSISLKINDAQPDLHNKIGEIYEFIAESEKALFHYKRAVSLDPHHVMANNNLVRFYIKKGQNELAEKHFSISYAMGRDKALPYFREAEMERKKGRLDASNALYTKAISHSPSMIEAYLGLYENYRSMERSTDAVLTLERLIHIKPDHEKAFIFLGHLYLNKRLPGKSRKYCLDQAVKNLTRAFTINPGNAHTAYILADVYRIRGDDLKAAEYEQKAQLLDNQSQVR